MKIQVIVTPNAKQEFIEEVEPRVFRIKTKARPIGGQANETVIFMLLQYFNVTQKQVKVLHGHTGRRKLIEIS